MSSSSSTASTLYLEGEGKEALGYFENSRRRTADMAGGQKRGLGETARPGEARRTRTAEERPSPLLPIPASTHGSMRFPFSSFSFSLLFRCRGKRPFGPSLSSVSPVRSPYLVIPTVLDAKQPKVYFFVVFSV